MQLEGIITKVKMSKCEINLITDGDLRAIDTPKVIWKLFTFNNSSQREMKYSIDPARLC